VPAGRPSLSDRWVAAQRARLERTRPSTPGADIAAERRFQRDVAGALALPLGRSAGIAVRTKAVDDEVARAIGRGTDQLVLFGAGYDGRAIRFRGTARWFEVDRPIVQADKRARLASVGIDQRDVAYVGTDFTSADLGDALSAAGHDPARPSLFVCDEWFLRLSLELVASVCRTVRDRAPDGTVLVASFRVAAEGAGLARLRRRASDPLFKMTGAARGNELRPGDPEKLMVVTGWRPLRTVASATSRLEPRSLVQVLSCEPGPRPPA
jgi:methyltransferase (TIGR00027 family)